MPVQTRSQRRRARAQAVVVRAQPRAQPRAPLPPERDNPAAAKAAEPEQDTECAICFEPMCWPHRLRCGHAFHASCLQRWRVAAHGNARCPLCRGPARPAPWHTLLEQGALAWLAARAAAAVLCSET